jgi:hypothetical protein
MSNHLRVSGEAEIKVSKLPHFHKKNKSGSSYRFFGALVYYLKEGDKE